MSSSEQSPQSFDLSYYDPLRARRIQASDPEQLAQELADKFPPHTAIRFMASPFPCHPPLLKRLQIHFEREKLLSHHEFSCFVNHEDLSADILSLFSQLRFLEIITELPLQHLNKAAWTQLFFRCREHGIKLRLVLNATPLTQDPVRLAEAHFFLRENMGFFTLNYTAGYFAHPKIDAAYRHLARVTAEAHQAFLVDEALNKNYYVGTYEYMRRTFSPRIKTVLEINPFAEQSYYKDFNRVPYTWDVTLSTLKQGHLDSAHLQQLNKTFDAILIFQGFPRMRLPEQVLQELKLYSRPTTQWICVHYNMASFPNLPLLLGNQWQNSIAESSFWSCLKMHSKQSLTQLFEPLDVTLNWVPTTVARPDLKRMEHFLGKQLKDFVDKAAWTRYLEQAYTMMWTASGEATNLLTAPLEAAAPTEEAVEGFVDGFIEGFI